MNVGLRSVSVVYETRPDVKLNAEELRLVNLTCYKPVLFVLISFNYELTIIKSPGRMFHEHGVLPEGKTLTGNFVNARQSSRLLSLNQRSTASRWTRVVSKTLRSL